MSELEIFGRLAVHKSGINFDSEEGQKRFHEIAPNLYNTMVNLYVLKLTADKEGIEAKPETVETQFKEVKKVLTDAGQYETFMKKMGLTEEKLRQTVSDLQKTNLLQKRIMDEGKSEPTPQEMHDYYYRHRSRFCFPNRIRASQIFIPAAEGDGEEKIKQARLQAEQLRKAIGDKPGERFVGLAQKYSADQTTAPRGGDLGFFSRTGPGHVGFKETAFSLPEGAVSNVIRTEMGYHIIWVTDYEQSFEEAKAEVKRLIVQERMNDYFNEWIQKARAQISIVHFFDPVTFTVLKEGKPDKPLEEDETEETIEETESEGG